MSSEIITVKDKKRRFFFFKSELLNYRMKFMLRQSMFEKTELQALHFQFFKKLKWVLPFFNQIRNRCNITGHSNSPYRYFKMSRMSVKNLASAGILTGIRKSSW